MKKFVKFIGTGFWFMAGAAIVVAFSDVIYDWLYYTIDLTHSASNVGTAILVIIAGGVYVYGSVVMRQIIKVIKDKVHFNFDF